MERLRLTEIPNSAAIKHEGSIKFIYPIISFSYFIEQLHLAVSISPKDEQSNN